MGKFKADPTDPVASAKGWTRRQRQAKRIEELWELLDTQRELYETSVARVGELEEGGKELGEIFTNLLRSKGHHITPEMIDAAWIMATTGGYQSAEEDLAIAVLSQLHIFQCEGCGGSGRFEAVGLYEDCEDCAPWDSKGWVIGDGK